MPVRVPVPLTGDNIQRLLSQPDIARMTSGNPTELGDDRLMSFPGGPHQQPTNVLGQLHSNQPTNRTAEEMAILRAHYSLATPPPPRDGSSAIPTFGQGDTRAIEPGGPSGQVATVAHAPITAEMIASLVGEAEALRQQLAIIQARPAAAPLVRPAAPPMADSQQFQDLAAYGQPMGPAESLLQRNTALISTGVGQEASTAGPLQANAHRQTWATPTMTPSFGTQSDQRLGASRLLNPPSGTGQPETFLIGAQPIFDAMTGERLRPAQNPQPPAQPSQLGYQAADLFADPPTQTGAQSQYQPTAFIGPGNIEMRTSWNLQSIRAIERTSMTLPQARNIFCTLMATESKPAVPGDATRFQSADFRSAVRKMAESGDALATALNRDLTAGQWSVYSRALTLLGTAAGAIVHQTLNTKIPLRPPQGTFFCAEVEEALHHPSEQAEAVLRNRLDLVGGRIPR
eukprot:GHVU01036158.1.p1 GENE.GHVU01036158.1~~GHVU01036158.1.p1  ORF type:complete len:489 (+),score=24.44 GHVU01036158.1:96-1469(+)